MDKPFVAQTTTLKKLKGIFEDGYNIALMQGGQGSGKNFACALYLLERQDCRVITVMSDTYGNLKDGIINDYEFIFMCNGLDFYNYFNKQDMELKWGNSKIQFRYLHDTKGQSGKSKRRDLLYINEGNRNGWAAVEHYIARSKQIIVDFNPDFEFWAHSELANRKDAKLIITTYKDNECCPSNEVHYIESRRHKVEWFKVYGLGQTGTYSDRMIYPFTVCLNIPDTAVRIASGMDFGKSPDPTVLVDCYLDGVKLYVHERFRANNLLPEKIPGATRMAICDKMEEVKFPTRQLIIGDSSGKTELLDLKKHNYNCRGVKKTAVLLGMKKLSAYDIVVTRESKEVISSFQSWLYDLDHNGKILPQPPKAHEPDAIAAIRYVAMARPLWKHLIPVEEQSLRDIKSNYDNKGELLNDFKEATKVSPLETIRRTMRGRGQKVL